MVTLIIARHGNTFAAGDTPTRVGVRTDLPLVETGKVQARALGHYLAAQNQIPDTVYTSHLQRTIETARIALQELKIDRAIYQERMFDEIDYGPDENKPETAVIARIGQDAITAWNEKAVVPPGWRVEPAHVIKSWHLFAERIQSGREGRVVLVVTSNGIARFAPHITGAFEDFHEAHDIKLRTGHMGILRYNGQNWQVTGWNINPAGQEGF